MAYINNGFASNYATATYTWLTAFTPNKPITINKIGTSAKHTDSSAVLSARIYNSAGKLVASSGAYACYPNQYTMMPLYTPLKVKAGETYYIGFHGSKHSVHTAGTMKSMTDGDLTVTFGETRYHGADSFPTSVSGVAPHSLQIDYVLDSIMKETFVNTNSGAGGSIQTWVAPYTGYYQIEAWGAQGGNKHVSGGRGAMMSGYFELQQGDILKILVGQQGQNVPTSQDNAAAGGGGGTFVARSNNTPLIVAGGGGGANGFSSVVNNGHGVVSNNGTGSNGSLVAGTGAGVNGGGGRAGGPGAGGGGGGFYSNGQRPIDTNGVTWSSDTGGISFIGGGAGKSGVYASYTGGFGGGGGAGHAGGGGGGYSGGAGGFHSSSSSMTQNGGPHGGGGGSYNAGINQKNSPGVRSGHGLVVITYYSQMVSVEEVIIDKSKILSGDTIEVSWTPSSYLEGLLYEVEVYTGTVWSVLETRLSEDKYSYKIPSDTTRYASARFRIRCFQEELMDLPSPWKNSPVFLIDKYMFVIKSDNKYYTYLNNDWVEIDETQDKDSFYIHAMGELSHVPEGKWAELISPISLVSFTNSETVPVVDVTVPSYKPIYLLEEKYGDLIVRSNPSSKKEVILHKVANPHGQLILANEDIILYAPTIPEIIKRVTITGTTSGTSTDNRRIVFSVDSGETYYTWLNNQWTEINVSKENVQSNGMTIETINDRTEEDWYEIFKDKPRHIRFAYYLELDMFNNQLSIDEIELLMDVKGEWKKVSRKDHEYSYPNDEVLQIELFRDGYYKINY